MQYANVSSVARLKQQIEDESQSGKRALHGTAQVASHRAVTRGMERMWNDIEKLERIAGKEVTKQFLMGL